jgi:hypothetical protein
VSDNYDNTSIDSNVYIHAVWLTITACMSSETCNCLLMYRHSINSTEPGVFISLVLSVCYILLNINNDNVAFSNRISKQQLIDAKNPNFLFMFNNNIQ